MKLFQRQKNIACLNQCDNFVYGKFVGVIDHFDFAKLSQSTLKNFGPEKRMSWSVGEMKNSECIHFINPA